LLTTLLMVEAFVADRTQRRPARIQRVAAALPAAHRSRPGHLLEWSCSNRTESGRRTVRQRDLAQRFEKLPSAREAPRKRLRGPGTREPELRRKTR